MLGHVPVTQARKTRTASRGRKYLWFVAVKNTRVLCPGRTTTLSWVGRNVHGMPLATSVLNHTRSSRAAAALEEVREQGGGRGGWRGREGERGREAGREGGGSCILGVTQH